MTIVTRYTAGRRVQYCRRCIMPNTRPRIVFDDEGVAYESGDSAPGRGNIWAVLEGGRKPALILLNHSDVVPADASAWEKSRSKPRTSGPVVR